MPFVDLKTQYSVLRDEINNRIDRVLEHGQYIMGPEVYELEEQLAHYVGARHCISASSGTDTLLIALMALGIGPGDEVITTPFTFISTGEVIALLGARPVFVDISPHTYNLDPAQIEPAITAKTRAIMPVSLYGQCADMDAIKAVAEKYDLPVVEDAAQSFGATYKGQKSCSLSLIGSTSFFPSKPLGCYGDGGALFTNDDTLAKSMREIRLHGQIRRYQHTCIGINGRMDTLQAAILLAKLSRFAWEVERRQALGARYTASFLECPTASCSQLGLSELAAGKTIILPWIAPRNTSVYAQYTVALSDRALAIRKLRNAGIPSAVHYPKPLHLQPAFANLGYREGDFPVVEEASDSVLSLPMSPDLTVESQDLVIKAVLEAMSSEC